MRFFENMALLVGLAMLGGGSMACPTTEDDDDAADDDVADDDTADDDTGDDDAGIEGGELQWAITAGGAGAWEGCGDILVLDGDPVWGGWNDADLTMGSWTLPGFGVPVGRLTPDGDAEWLTGPVLDDWSNAEDLEVLSTGEVLVTGEFHGSGTFGDGPGAVEVVSAGGFDAFLAIYDADGDFQWVTTFGDTGEDMATISRALDDGGWITLGRFEDTVVFGEGEPNETTLVAGSVNGFLARFAADGTLQWVQHLLSEGGTVETFWALEQDAGDSVLVGGKASRTVVFDPTGKPTEYDFGIDGRFVVRYGLDGAFRGVVLHSSEEETNAIEYVYSLAVHPDGGFVVSGGYDGSSVLSHEEVPACPPSSTGCGFLSRFDADDQPLWVRTIESGSSDGLARVFVLPGGDVLLGGWVCSSVFPEASCEQVVYGVGTPDAVMESTDNGLKTGFVSRWDGANGDLQWVRQLHGDRSSVWGLAADGDDLYVCGTFDGEAVYGAGEPWAQTLSGDQDLYIMKITD